MLLGIVSDIHGNLEALQAVNERLEALGAQQVLCAGDIIGYGANPYECVEHVIDRGWLSVTGNHEAAVLSESASIFFNRVARKASSWTSEHLDALARVFLSSLPYRRVFDEWGVILVHAELSVPALFDYIQSAYDASDNLIHIPPDSVCFTGHSHSPIVFLGGETVLYDEACELTLPRGIPAIVNVGSVGQPRDGDRRSCFATYDTAARRLHLHRVWYDAEAAETAILQAGLPEVLGERLRFGR